MIEASHVSFEYPGVRALDDVSFALPPRSITALVGPNGAGKTTLLRCLAALDEPLGGSIRIDGIDVRLSPRLCHERVGYLSDFFGLYDALTTRRCLAHAASARRIPPPERVGAVERAAERLGIVPQLDKRAGDLSRGLRQRLAIAQAIVHEPRVLLLDEPASGLDPDARMSLSELFLELGGQGMTLLVSSHILAELDTYCSQILILREGRLIEDRGLGEIGPVARSIRVALANPVPDLAEILAAGEGVSEVRCQELEATFSFSGDLDAQGALLRSWVERGLPLVGFAEERANLQEVYRERVRAGNGGTP